MSKIKYFLFFIFLLNTLNVYSQSEYQDILKRMQGKKIHAIVDSLIGKDFFNFEKVSYEGETLNSDSLRGKVVVINFWFINCPPCVAEMDGLNSIVDKYGDRKDIEFISFALDDKKSLEEDFFSKREFKFEVIPDAMSFLIMELDNPFGFPTTFIVDKKGKIRKMVVGGSQDADEASAQIQSELNPIIDIYLNED